MEIGKYYTRFFNGDEFYFKALSLKDKNVYFNWYICNKKYYKGEKGNFLPIPECEEITFQELFDYLPNNNIDKKTYIRMHKIQNLLNGNR